MTDRETRLDSLLDDLPREVPVPPGLDASTLRRARASTTGPLPSPNPMLRLAAALLMGALLGASVMATRPAPELVLTAGSQLVTGSARVFAGDREVLVRGRALISVEPGPGLLREQEQEADTMKTQTLAAALAGSLITVAVYEGRAVISGGDEQSITVASGETRSVGAPPAPQRRRVVVEAPDIERGSRSQDHSQGEIARLRAEIAGLRASQALTRGQLQGLTGQPQPWPTDLPDAFLPAAFERSMRALVAQEGAGELLALDCSEFPCLTVLAPTVQEGNDMPPEVQAVIDGMQALLGDSGVSVHNSRTRDGDADLLLTGLAFAPKGAMDEDTQTRAAYRMEGHLQGLAEELMGEPSERGEEEDGADEDIEVR